MIKPCTIYGNEIRTNSNICRIRIIISCEGSITSSIRSTIGIWGVIAFMDILAVFFILFYKGNKIYLKKIFKNDPPQKLVYFCIITIILYLIAYFNAPYKAAYLIPVIPFVIILFNIFWKKIYFVGFSFSVILSSFFIGISLNDPLRGSIPSSLSYDFNISGQNLSIDFLRGPVMAEHIRRKNKMEFSQKVVEDIKPIKRKTLIIAGFWLNDILVKMPSPTDSVMLVYYIDDPELKKYSVENFQILYLPEQDYYNDLCYKKVFTKNFAKPFYP